MARAVRRTTVGAGFRILALVLAASAAVACSRAATTAVSPSGVKCQVGVSAPADVLESTGATSSVAITAQPECAWSVSSEAAWIAVQAPASGQGNGKVDFRALPNPTSAVREGALVLNDQRLAVRQHGAACRWELAPQSRTVGAASTSAVLAVNTLPGCAWTATSDAPWITITSGATGEGPGEVSYQLSANAGDARSGRITVADQSVLLAQAAGAALAPGCQMAVSPTEFAVTAGERLIAVDAIANGDCAWTAVSTEPWLSVRSAASTTGSGVVSIAVAANSGGSRSGLVTVAGRAIVVTQAGGGCAVAFGPSTLSVGSAGGDLTATVTAPAGCLWTVATADAWLKVLSGSPGSGNGVVTFSALPNAGTARSGAVYIAGQPLTVTQEGSCDSSIDPVAQPIAISGGSGTVAVTAPTGCAWTAKSNDSWIALTSGAAGSGAGSVAFMVAANSGPARTGTLTIAGKTISIAQGTNCSFAVTPSTVSVPLGGGSGGPISVTTAAGCTWTAVSSSNWLSISSGATGTGNGTVLLSAMANAAGSRTGTLTVAGQTVTVSQGDGCTVTASPTLIDNLPVTPGTGPAIAVNATAGCAWTAKSTEAWITTTGAAAGTGNGSVTFAFEANTGSLRQAAIVIAGQMVTIRQQGSCNSSIDPVAQSIESSGGPGTVAVTAPAGCTWTARSNDGWITLTSSAPGSGAGSAAYTVAANTGPGRTGTLTIAGKTLSVVQATGCGFAVAPTAASLPIAGGSGGINVTTAAGCTWTAASGSSWLTISSGAAGTGTGSVAFSATPNPGGPRTGNLTVAGTSVTVSQGGTCTVTVAPTRVDDLPNTESTGPPLAVTATAGCSWAATSSESWIRITSGAGVGNGTVTFIVEANPGKAREGVITIGGQAVTVRQVKN